MDFLTHAIEGYTTKAAWEMTDMFHLEAIKHISQNLRGAVENTPEGREEDLDQLAADAFADACCPGLAPFMLVKALEIVLDLG